MLRGEMTQNGGWSPERPTMSLDSWGFESVEPPGKARGLKIEFKLVANGTELNGASWMVNASLCQECDVPCSTDRGHRTLCLNLPRSYVSVPDQHPL